jgi:hypothetical protein
MQPVMPPFMQVEPAIGMALYSARAILHGRGGDFWEMEGEFSRKTSVLSARPEDLPPRKPL